MQPALDQYKRLAARAFARRMTHAAPTEPRRRMRGLIGILALAVAACGGSSSPAFTPGGACTITLSGAQTGTYDCTNNVAAVYNPGNNQGGLMIAFKGSPTGSLDINLLPGFPGAPTTGTVSNSTSGTTGGLEFDMNSGASMWSSPNTTVSPATGTWTFTLTAIGPAQSTGGALEAYPIHGTLDGTLTGSAVTSTPTSGTVTVHASF
jgi:hypothetical protein